MRFSARQYAFALLALGLVVSFAAFLRFNAPRLHPPANPAHVFELREPPKFLTEELALAYANESLKQEGLNPADWRPVPDGRTHAPDGRVDAYLARTRGTPNRGVLLFTRGGLSPKFVAVELKGSRVLCENAPGR